MPEAGQWSRNLVDRRHKAKALISLGLIFLISKMTSWPKHHFKPIFKAVVGGTGVSVLHFQINQKIPLFKLDSSRISLVRGGHGSQDAPGESEVL